MVEKPHKMHTILFAEDDEDDQDLIMLAFSRVQCEHEIKIVNNGRELLDLLSKTSDLPCLIVLDLNMPVLGGIQTLELLNSDARFRKIPKIILTTSDSDENKRISFHHGAVDYFVKPSRIAEIAHTIEQIVKYC